MRSPRLSAKSLSLLLVLAASTTTLPAARAAHISFQIPPTTLLPNPSTLPSSTQAQLYAFNSTQYALLDRGNAFEFADVGRGSWLFTVSCRDFVFGPLRVDVLPSSAAAAAESTTDASGGATAAETVEVFQTFWGNEWGNKGEARGGGTVSGAEDVVGVEVRPERVKEYYVQRQGFSPLEFLKSPMILIAIFSLVLIVGMPYLMDNMDEETRAEFEDIQRKSPMAAAANPTAALQNFDIAGWMAGSKKRSGGGS